MNSFCLKRPYVLTVVYLIITIVIGLFVVLLPLNQTECNIVLDLHNFTQRTIGLQVFQVLTYLGDFYFWAVLTSVYFLYAYFKLRKHLGSATCGFFGHNDSTYFLLTSGFRASETELFGHE
jgi:hypothetical protein